MRPLDEMTGTTPIAGEIVGLLYFVLPHADRPSFTARLKQVVLSLSVKDQDGIEWGTERRLDSFGDDEIEKYTPDE